MKNLTADTNKLSGDGRGGGMVDVWPKVSENFVRAQLREYSGMNLDEGHLP